MCWPFAVLCFKRVKNETPPPPVVKEENKRKKASGRTLVVRKVRRSKYQPEYVYYPRSDYVYAGHQPYYYEYPCGLEKYSTKPLKDGSLPYYGRTASEVDEDWRKECAYQQDEIKKAAASPTRKKKADAKSLEPKGKPSDQYWVVHREGDMKAYPLGTIRANFEGEWKIDAHGWPYLQEK